MKIYMTEEQKVNILTQRETKKVKDIAVDLSIPPSTIYSFLSKYQRTKKLSKLKSPGAPIKLTSNCLRRIERFINKKPNTTLKEIIEKHRLNICRQTLSKFLYKNKIRKFNMPKKPKLTKENIEERKAWAIRNRRTNWEETYFLDETSVELGQRFRTKAWRKYGKYLKKGTYIKTKKVFIKKYAKFITFIGKDKIGEMIFVNKWNKNNFLRLFQKLFENEIINGKQIVMDNDKCHSSNIVMSYLRENNIKLIKHPSNSPDLNCIENAFSYFKKHLSLSLPKPKNLEQLKEVVPAIWKNTPIHIVNKLILSMKRRVDILFSKNGDILRY